MIPIPIFACDSPPCPACQCHHCNRCDWGFILRVKGKVCDVINLAKAGRPRRKRGVR